MHIRQLRYSSPKLRLESANSFLGYASNSMYLFRRGSLWNCDNDIVLCHFHGWLLWAGITVWLPTDDRRRLDRLLAKAVDNKLISSPYVPVTICFSFLAFVLVLIGR